MITSVFRESPVFQLGNDAILQSRDKIQWITYQSPTSYLPNCDTKNSLVLFPIILIECKNTPNGIQPADFIGEICTGFPL